VALLPVGAALLAELANPGYIADLLQAPLAPALLAAAAVCQLVACLLIRRIARVGEGG
jgi:Flp pilus assembly protein TadB